MAADVKEMYHQFERTVFGEMSAPSRANYTMRRNADENGEDLPLGVKAVYKCFYMDDGLSSTDSREEAIELRKQMTVLLRRGGFHLHRWLTNDQDVLATIPQQDRFPRFLELSEDKLPTDRTLGVIWDAQEDMLRFTGLKGDPGTTKRKILSQAFSVWDSRGLLLSFTIRSKIILQSLNRMKYGWDDELKEADLQEWREWHRETGNQDAYGACTYLRRAFTDDTVECSLIAGKGRVSPLKLLSICWLELMGALVAVRLAETLVKEMTAKIEKIILWSGSITALHWIRQKSSTYKAFVGNRVSEIHTIMSNLETSLGVGTVSWRYVPTEANPADDISRGLGPTELCKGFRYNSGPKFLYESAELWPENKVEAPSEKDEVSEKKKGRWAGASQENEVLLG
ncbi:uncharacterized protein [Pocillopora verrucosa]|uniref:uncharacterized protein n=1 Tax=Pocillopora verrucosa TaxID=203993 RepID=UPI00333FB0DD